MKEWITKKEIRHRHVAESESQLSHELNPLLSRIYRARGVISDKQLQKSLVGLCDPAQLTGIDVAVRLLIDALRQQQHILIVGDYDADGATSTSLALLALREMGAAHVSYLVPNRFEFGYGLTPEIVELAKSQQPDLLITVDNGISSITGVEAAKKIGMDVIVTDHHLPGEELPKADAIVNPNQPGCEFPSKFLAGVGVIFYVMLALRSQLRQQNWFSEQGINEPNLATYLDLVALGTVADVVPLDSNNRILVHQGLARMRAGQARPGILALANVAGRDYRRFVAADLGFALGPRLNAAGRLDDMSLGIECLLAEDDNLAHEMAIRLDELNKDRKTIESDMQAEAMTFLNQQNVTEQFVSVSDVPFGICLFNESWHQGVVGILASRVKDRFHRPVIAFAAINQNEIKGSARSIPGLHIRDALALIDAKHPHLITHFGGHAMAAGLTLPKSHFTEFKMIFDQEVKSLLTEEQLTAVIYTDGALQADEFDLQVAELLRDGGPWGQQFPEPLFDGEFKLLDQYLVGAKHLKMVLGYGHQVVDAIAFNVDLEYWPNKEIEQIKIAYHLDVNDYRGEKKLQLLVDYIEPIN